jgi:hypothetical protein
MMGYGFEFEMFPKSGNIVHIIKDHRNKGVAVKFNCYPKENVIYS